MVIYYIPTLQTRDLYWKAVFIHEPNTMEITTVMFSEIRWNTATCAPLDRISNTSVELCYTFFFPALSSVFDILHCEGQHTFINYKTDL